MINSENVRTITYKIPPSFDGKYLKDFLLTIGYSMELIKHLKQTTNIDAFKLLKAGENITINIIEDEKSDIKPNKDLKFDILYEDIDMIIVNKPSDMPIHPSQGNYDNTLGNALTAYFQGQNFVYRHITRLDRDTTGVCLIAKNKLSAAIFQTMMKNNLIKRSYIGVVQGNIYNTLYTVDKLKQIDMIENTTNLEIVIEKPIVREDDSTIKRTISNQGEYALTKVHALNYNKLTNTSVCKFILLTGRTHQIRVHMKHLGFPIIGDFLYNPDYSLIKRQALHSNEIILNHPITHNLMRVVSKLPLDMKNIM